jgi:polyhydroxyalkanoate synthesis regulator phasin
MPTLKAPKVLTPLKLPTPATPDWKRAMETGMQFTELRRSQARTMANDLVAQGQIAREQVASAVEDLIDMSRKRSDGLRNVVRDEVQRQLGTLGFATKRDLAALERRMLKATREAKKKPTGSSKKSASKKAGTKSAKSSNGSETKAG